MLSVTGCTSMVQTAQGWGFQDIGPRAVIQLFMVEVN